MMIIMTKAWKNPFQCNLTIKIKIVSNETSYLYISRNKVKVDSVTATETLMVQNHNIAT